MGCDKVCGKCFSEGHQAGQDSSLLQGMTCDESQQQQATPQKTGDGMMDQEKHRVNKKMKASSMSAARPGKCKTPLCCDPSIGTAGSEALGLEK